VVWRFDPGPAKERQTVRTKPGARQLAALLALSAAWLLLSCVPVLAHARLVETYPADEDTLAEPPEQVQLLYNEPVEAAFDPIEVYDPEGDRVNEDDVREASDNRRLLIVDLVEGLPEGSYTVEWRVTSADGHPVSGEYGFDVDPSATDSGAGDSIEPVERTAEREVTGPTWSTILAVTLGVLLVGTLVVVGLVVLRRRKGAV
jgi:copper resistance protein C